MCPGPVPSAEIAEVLVAPRARHVRATAAALDPHFARRAFRGGGVEVDVGEQAPGHEEATASEPRSAMHTKADKQVGELTLVL